MLKIYSKDFITEYGSLDTIVEALVEEERNGLFELSFTILNTDSLFSYIEKENIVICNANDTLLNQKFRIYDTRKLMNNRVQVFARHISFDLMYDRIDSLSFENQSCEYALNQLFRNSNFSQHYRGYSDIVNAQNYSISNSNILSAIGGTKGSIIDTFGNGAEILRDNENIHVLNRRGHDNSVTIEYRKNLTGFELEEDTTDLETRCGGYVKYTDSETSEEMVLTAWADSPLIDNYAHPYIRPDGPRDYSDQFEDGYIPTIVELQTLIEKEFSVNKRDIVKENYKIEFIPLSKCVGYEALNDNISLCDTVTIKDARYNVNTQAKVIKTVFNVLKNRYESIELGEPKTSLGDIISSSSDNKVTEEQVKDIVSSTPSTNYPNTLPSIPILESFVYGFANIELRWTFENKVYYAYEVYASKTKDFTPNTFDLIYQGQASSYMFQAEPNETWYFKVCGINSYNRRTQFSNEVEVVTTKISDLSNYVSEMAIGEALIGELNLGRGWIGQLNANLLDVKGNFSVTDGNGKRTIDIDSFGNVSILPTSFYLLNENSEVFDARNEMLWNFKEVASLRIEQGKIQTEVSKKVGVEEVKTTIEQNPTSVQVGFNGVNNRYVYTNDGFYMKHDNGNNKASFKRGSFYTYNYVDGTFLGGLTPFLFEGTFNAGQGIINSSNSYFFTIGKDPNLLSDTQDFATELTSYFTLNFRDRDGEGNAYKYGMQVFTPSYFYGDITSNGSNIYNVNQIQCLDLHTTFIQDRYGNKVFNLTEYDAFNYKNWDWGGKNLVNCNLVGTYDTYLATTMSVVEEDINIIDNVEVIKKNDGRLGLINIASTMDLGNNNFEYSQLIYSLVDEVKKLKEEIRIMKEGV